MTHGPPGTDAVPQADDVQWMRVEGSSAPGSVRRRAMELAEQLGLSDTRVGEIGIVATELASNLLKHAQEGAIVLRVLRDGALGGLEIVALDRGPGMRDVSGVFEDGRSTSGTLGIGLGAVHRLATTYDIHSTAGSGTIVTATFWPEHAAAPAGMPVAGLTRPFTGEDTCGDAYAVRPTSNGVLIMLCDGLGHGHLAARASAEAVRVFRESSEESPAAVVTQLHRALSVTRGAAVAVARVEHAAGRLTYAGVGNISGRVLTGERSRGLMSHAGIVGHNARTIRDLVYEIEPTSWVVMHSDGLSEKWDLSLEPGLMDHSPLVVATLLMREAGIRRDDASVVVARAR